MVVILLQGATLIQNFRQASFTLSDARSPLGGGQGKGWGMGWSWGEKLMAVLFDFVRGRGDNFFFLFMIWENV